MSRPLDLLTHVQDYVVRLLTEKIPPSIVYHNCTHTEAVVAATKILGKGNHLDEHQRCLLEIAAWFHDTGYVVSNFEHERKSIQIAKDFLYPHLTDQELKEIIGAIEATIMPQNPKTLLEQCLCDADLYGLSLPSFYENSLLLRQEWQNLYQKHYTDQEWIAQNLIFLEKHEYHTPFAKKYFQTGKEENILKMRCFLQ